MGTPVYLGGGGLVMLYAVVFPREGGCELSI